eukprot:COSAG02_NODE_12277_length_1569_cov_2.451020_1_plen_179_part_00
MPGEHAQRGRNCGICTVSLLCVLVALVIFKDWAATPAGTFDCTADPDDNTDCANNATAATACSDGGPFENEGQCDGKGHCICPDSIFGGIDAFFRMVMVLLGVCAGCIIAVVAIACGCADVCLEDMCFRQRSCERANLLPATVDYVTASTNIPNGDQSTGGSATKYGAVAVVRGEFVS